MNRRWILTKHWWRKAPLSVRALASRTWPSFRYCNAMNHDAPHTLPAIPPRVYCFTDGRDQNLASLCILRVSIFSKMNFLASSGMDSQCRLIPSLIVLIFTTVDLVSAAAFLCMYMFEHEFGIWLSKALAIAPLPTLTSLYFLYVSWYAMMEVVRSMSILDCFIL